MSHRLCSSLTMILALTSVVALITSCCLKLGDGAVSARIVTRPPQGPFSLRQTVQFTCEVDSLPTENLIFQWRSVEYTYGGSSYSGQSFNKTFNNEHSLRYVWFFCSILKNTTQLASSERIVEIHGLLNTDDLVTRNFSLNQKILLQINSLSGSSYGYLATYISSLTWYHNDTEILSNERMNISNNGTSLTISDMIDSDAGKYEVKISSIDYFGYSSSATCDRSFLRMLEQTALHASVTFYLQQYYIPKYKPEDIIELYFLPMNSLANSNHTFIINHTTDVNATYIFGGNSRYFHQRFFKNGVYQSNTDNVITEQSYDNEINISHQLRYSDTNEIVGHYVYMETAFVFANSINCNSYRYYLQDYSIFFDFIVLVHYWSLMKSEDDIEARIARPKVFPQCSDGSQVRRAIISDVIQYLINKFGVQPLGTLPEFPATSCSEIEQAHIQPLPRLYWISQNGTTPIQMWCDF